MNKIIQEAAVYLVVAISSLFIMGFVMHMLVGGLVSSDTEELLIILICLVDLIAISLMARDVIRRRQGLK
jgi:hypothetical protein